MASAATTVSRPLRLPRLSGDQRLFAFASLLGVTAAVLWLLPLRHAAAGATTFSLPWWGALAACYMAGLLTVDLGVRRRMSVSLAEAPLVLGLFFVEPLVLVGCYSLGVLLASWTRRGVQPARDYGNLLLDATFVTVALVVFAALRPVAGDPLAPRSILAALAAMAAAGCVLAPMMLVAGVALYRGRVVPGDVVHQFTTETAGTVASTSLAVVVLGLAGSRPWLGVALAPPLLLIAGLQATAAGARGRAESAAFLVRAGEVLRRGAPVSDRAEALLDALLQTFDAERVELVLTGEQRTAALHFRTARGDGRLVVEQRDLTEGELEALRGLDGRRVTTVRADATHTPLWRFAAERGLQRCAACALPGSERAQGLLVLDRAPRSRRHIELLLATASLVGAAAARGELITRDRRQGGDGTRDRHGEPRILHGRPPFADAISTALGRLSGIRRPLALLVVDLDGFMAIRGTYGDTIADAVLTTVTSRLRQHLRRYDVLAHLGNERVAILLESLRHRSDAEVVAQRLVRTLQQAIELGGDSIVLTGSVGIAVIDDFDSIPSTDELIHRADMAVYLAKRQAGKRYLVFDSAARQPIIAAAPTPKN